MFADDDEGKDKGALIKFAKKAIVAILLIVALPSVIPPLMGVEDTMGCWTNEDGCTTNNNPILTDDFTRLAQIVLDTIRGGGAVAIIIAGGYRGLQYCFIIPVKSADESSSEN